MATIKFKTAYDTKTKEAKATPSGTKIITEHREEIDQSGRRILVKDREINIYEKIQASAESCEIETILRRAAEGDTSVLNMVNGQYIDITGAPKTLAEAQQFVIRAKAEFDKLPKDIKFKFENNCEMYVAQYGTKEWADKTGLTAETERQAEIKTNREKFNINVEKSFEKIAEGGLQVNE